MMLNFGAAKEEEIVCVVVYLMQSKLKGRTIRRRKPWSRRKIITTKTSQKGASSWHCINYARDSRLDIVWPWFYSLQNNWTFFFYLNIHLMMMPLSSFSSVIIRLCSLINQQFDNEIIPDAICLINWIGLRHVPVVEHITTSSLQSRTRLRMK